MDDDDDEVAAGEAGPAPAAAATGGHADRVFRALALASLYILFRRWRAGGAGLAERPSPAEIAAAVALCASVAWLYALPAFGIRRSSEISTRRWHQD
ncbi:uncharacterized protein [Oryza sativa Japonica Group]|uniref:Os07g0470400 protein n=6 Tax=Oryza TaxID=4527 RepID=Q0D6K7_ORYSJ|nr:uncharacterized protein LOC4343194 [Oryza sativa Japonica Group]XP_015645637.1 uncharacterized protein LOC4343194 [Oryza sativa Japonica Group]XP_052162856.1 uncharacterized protein LOC127779963 [Oryza glaberrima]EAZ03807.1 hypothetical protein OsI_25936 [Oryza sativa Indica Group]KAB8105346.1 hypothetical protein EE612_039116 [Oryza sativa]KAF2922744.1 hypothetical protein DAI22_07g136866 [Oryza sativa Japonica Group]KAF2922745.1 hypothetical protein DAI22_07g136866 [Oryza sativa Japonica|eukprot:NP_001059602.1 Os07g0470400 [Oryza sativa Japonica Group]